MCGSIRKYHTQMSKNEIQMLRNNLINQGFPTLTLHTKMRMEEKGITEEDISKALENFYIIEFHRKDRGYYGHDNRVVIRGTNRTKGFNICMSISLSDGHLVTVYKNYNTDRHPTLDTSKYNRNVEIGKYIN